MPAGLPIPRPEPVPLPAPVWLLESLLILTFFLHVIPMAAVLGGSALTLVSDFLGRTRSAYRDLTGRLLAILPLAMPATITLGVAPLLFVQLLYGSLFYPASVLMGWPWLGTLGLILLAYYGMYAAAWAGKRLGRARTWVLVGVTLAVGAVAFIFSRNYAFMLEPERWLPVYAANPRGTALPPQGPDALPRFLHALLAAFALAGGYLAAYAALRGQPDDGEVAPAWAGAARQLGLGALAASLAAQAVVAPWYFSTLPAAARAALLGMPGGLALMVAGPVLALAGLAALARAVPGRPAARALGLGGGLSVVLAALPQAILRELARRAVAVGYLDPSGWQAVPQWGLIAVFALFLVLAVGTVTALVVRFAREAATARAHAHAPSPGD